MATEKLPPMTERDWQHQVIDLAKLFGWRVYHPFLSKWSERGFPDLTLVRERLIFVELKREDGRLSPHQEEWLDALKAAGVECYVWRPSDFGEAQETLRRRIPGMRTQGYMPGVRQPAAANPVAVKPGAATDARLRKRSS